MPSISTLPVIPPDSPDPAFWVDPYPHHIQMSAAPDGVDWPQLGYRCLARHDHVNALLRDRRYGHQILHTCTRAELGWPEPEAHLAPWLAFESHSPLELEPPAHTRLRAMVKAPFIPRRIECLAPAIAAYAHLLDSLSVAKVAVIALSHRGPSALPFAALYSERVSSLTLFSAAAASADSAQAAANRKGGVRWRAYSSGMRRAGALAHSSANEPCV